MQGSDNRRMPAASAREVFLVFLKLGLGAFGGPLAHIGLFRETFVQRRRWLDDAGFADLLALCQFLPGPASSQLGFAIGLGRAGWLGGLAAWAGFTLPSALALMAFAQGLLLAQGGDGLDALLHGLKVVAVAVVVQAVWGMARTLCPDWRRAGIAAGAAMLALALPGPAAQLLVIGAGGLLGRWLPALPAAPAGLSMVLPLDRRQGLLLCGLVLALLLILPLLAAAGASPLLGALAVVYQAGALVFGGGHVVLPLLQAGLVPPGWIGEDLFLAGYGAAQAVPGPLFSVAAFLGAVLPAPHGGWLAGLLLLVAIFLPGLLLLAAALPYWDRLRRRQDARQALAGINAAVVGLLAAALYDPVWRSAILGWTDAALALGALALLLSLRVSPLLVIGLTAAASWLFSGL